MLKLIIVFIVTAVQAYIIGGVNGSIIISKYFYRKDIRKFGSGNPGLTNFYRVFGKGGAVLVVLIDVLKTAVPVVIGGALFAWFVDPGFFASGLRGYLNLSFFGSEAAALFAMLGTCYPLFYEFRGGKSVMAMGTVVFFIDWRIALVAWGVFLLVVLLTRYVSLGAILGVIAYPIMVAALGIGGVWELIPAVLSAALLIARHHENIGRLIKGTEHRLSFRRNKKEKSNPGDST